MAEENLVTDGKDKKTESERKRRLRCDRALTPEQVSEVLRLYAKGYSYGRLAELFPVTRSTIYKYVKGIRKHYED